MIGCSSKGGTEQNIFKDGYDTGMYAGHAYSLIHLFELQRKPKEESDAEEEDLEV